MANTFHVTAHIDLSEVSSVVHHCDHSNNGVASWRVEPSSVNMLYLTGTLAKLRSFANEILAAAAAYESQNADIDRLVGR